MSNARRIANISPRVQAICGSSRLVAADASGTETLIPFTEQTDTGNDFASNTFTCPIDGSYFVSFFGMCINPDAYAFVTIRLNTTTKIAAYEDTQGGKTGSNNFNCTGIIAASKDDTIKAFFGGGSTNSKLHEGAYGAISIMLVP